MVTPREPDGLRDQSIGDLLKELSAETSTLIRQEMALARAEMTEKGKRACVGAGMLGGAGVAGLLALGTLTACILLVLNEFMDAWLAALILTVVWAAVAGVLALKGRDAAPPAPEQTIETVKEDVEWAKTRRPSGAR
jgi:hypothetical protein